MPLAKRVELHPEVHRTLQSLQRYHQETADSAHEHRQFITDRESAPQWARVRNARPDAARQELWNQAIRHRTIAEGLGEALTNQKLNHHAVDQLKSALRQPHPAFTSRQIFTAQAREAVRKAVQTYEKGS